MTELERYIDLLKKEFNHKDKWVILSYDRLDELKESLDKTFSKDNKQLDMEDLLND